MPSKTVFDKTGLIPGEVMWKDADENKLESILSSSLNFYSEITTKKDIKNDLFLYLKQNKLVKPVELKSIKQNYDVIPFTTYKLSRMLNLEFPAKSETGIRMKKSILEDIVPALDNVVKETEDEPIKISPLQRIETNVGESIITQLEDMLDDWMKDMSKPPEPLQLSNIVRTTGIPIQGYRFIYSWLDKFIDELQLVLDGDEYAKESYSHMKKGDVRAWHKALLKMKTDLEKLEGKQKEVKKKERKTRVKKPQNQFQIRKQIRKKVERIKYLEKDEELNLTSISPEKIIGSNHLFIYNTKYKTLGYMTAESRSGLDLKGMSVVNFNDKLSFSIKLRKPNEFFSRFNGENTTLRKIENDIEKLTTKKIKMAGRLGENILILKVFK
jgi:hypothetical protein